MRRIAAMIIALLLAALPCMAETVAVSMWTEVSSFMLLRDDGEVLVGAGIYGEIEQVTPMGYSPALFKVTPANYSGMSELLEAVRRDEAKAALEEAEYGMGYVEPRYALMDENGVRRTDYLYSYFSWYEEPGVVVAVRVDGGTEVLDAQGNELYSGPDREVYPLPNGSYVQVRGESEDASEIWLQRADGARTKLCDTDRYTYVAIYDGGIFAVDAHWLYSQDGELLLEADAQSSIEGVGCGVIAVWRYDGETTIQLLDLQGEPIPGAERLSAFNFLEDGGYVIVAEDGAAGIYDRDGTCTAELTDVTADWVYEQVNGIISITSREHGELFVDPEGRRLFFDGYLPENASLNAYYSVCEGRPTVAILSDGEGRESLIAQDGTTIGIDGDGYLIALCWLDGHGLYQQLETRTDCTTLYDETGRQLLPYKVRDLTQVGRDRFWVRRGSVWQLIDSVGNVYHTEKGYSRLDD